MKKKLMDYIREESQCNYFDLIDYTMMVNTLGSDKLKADALLDVIWFIASEELKEEQERLKLSFVDLVKDIMEAYITDDETYDSENEVTFNMYDVNLNINGIRWENYLKDAVASHGYNIEFTYGDRNWTTVINITLKGGLTK